MEQEVQDGVVPTRVYAAPYSAGNDVIFLHGEHVQLLYLRLVPATVVTQKISARHAEISSVGENLVPAREQQRKELPVESCTPARLALRRVRLAVQPEQRLATEGEVGVEEGLSVAEADDRLEDTTERLLPSQIVDTAKQVAVGQQPPPQIWIVLPQGSRFPMNPAVHDVDYIRVELDLVPEVVVDSDLVPMATQHGGEQDPGFEHLSLLLRSRPVVAIQNAHVLIRTSAGQVQAGLGRQLGVLGAGRDVDCRELWNKETTSVVNLEVEKQVIQSEYCYYYMYMYVPNISLYFTFSGERAVNSWTARSPNPHPLPLTQLFPTTEEYDEIFTQRNKGTT